MDSRPQDTVETPNGHLFWQALQWVLAIVLAISGVVYIVYYALKYQPKPQEIAAPSMVVIGVIWAISLSRNIRPERLLLQFIGVETTPDNNGPHNKPYDDACGIPEGDRALQADVVHISDVCAKETDYDQVSICGVSLTDELRETDLDMLKSRHIAIRLLLVDSAGLACSFAAMRSKFRAPSEYKNRTKELLRIFRGNDREDAEVRLLRYPPSFGLIIFESTKNACKGKIAMSLFMHHTPDRLPVIIDESRNNNLYNKVKADFGRMWASAASTRDRHYEKKRLLVLVGPPYPGKTTLGMLAKLWGYTLKPNLMAQSIQSTLKTQKHLESMLNAAELKRDSDIAESDRDIIIEGWHIGNLAYMYQSGKGGYDDETVQQIVLSMQRFDYCVYLIKVQQAVLQERKNQSFLGRKSEECRCEEGRRAIRSWQAAFSQACSVLQVPQDRIVQLQMDGEEQIEDVMDDILKHEYAYWRAASNE